MQSSFINEEISEKLNLPLVRKEGRFTQSFEDKNAEPQILNVVKAKIKSIHNKKFLNIRTFCCSENMFADHKSKG